MAKEQTSRKRKPVLQTPEPARYVVDYNCGNPIFSDQPPVSGPRKHLPEPQDYYPH
jgi:hypothetical protein